MKTQVITYNPNYAYFEHTTSGNKAELIVREENTDIEDTRSRLFVEFQQAAHANVYQVLKQFVHEYGDKKTPEAMVVASIDYGAWTLDVFASLCDFTTMVISLCRGTEMPVQTKVKNAPSTMSQNSRDIDALEVKVSFNPTKLAEQHSLLLSDLAMAIEADSKIFK